MKVEFCLLFLLVSFLFVGCEKNTPNNVSLNANIEHYNYPNGAKVYIDDQNYSCWVEGDTVLVNDDEVVLHYVDDIATLDGIQYNEAGYVAVYPSSIVAAESVKGLTSINVSLPVAQNFKKIGDNQILEAPLLASVDEGGEGGIQFRNLCALLKVTLTNNQERAFRVRGISVSAPDAVLCGEGTITVPSSTINVAPSLEMGEEGSKSVMLAMPEVEMIPANESRIYYIVLPPFSNQQLTITVVTDIDGVICKASKTMSGNCSLSRNKLGSIEIHADNVVSDASPCGAYAVSATQNVNIAMGNLQYCPKQGVFRFAENQRCSELGNNINWYDTYSEWLDLFCWGTGNSPMTAPGANASTYGPADTDISASSYDWGTNPISNGGGSANVWRTMTSSEWSYILSNGYAKAQVGEVDGMVIKPNDWINPQGIGILQTGTDYSANRYSASEWVVMEAAGAIFLPVTGYLKFSSNNYSVSNSSNGYYWSSTPADVGKAYTLVFSTTCSMSNKNRNLGHAVRLVKNVQ